MTSNLERFLRRHGYFLIALLLLGVGTYNLCLSIYPLDGDNLAALDLGANKDVLSLLKGSSILGLPFYRPIPYITVILQYHVFGLRIPPYFVFNLGVWIACAWCVYLFVARLSKSRLAALAAAGLALLDPRALPSLTWIGERQSSMSGLFGLAALLVLLLPLQDRWKNARRLAIFLLLLLSPLCKEYGLAFAGVVILFVFLSKDRDWKALTVVALLAVAAYAALRLYSGVVSLTNYCEEIGFFQEVRNICYRDLDLGAQLQQQAYNAGASLVGTFFPGFFSSYGTISISLREVLIANLPIFLLAAVGFLRSPRRTLPLLGLIFLNAMLNFAIYRERNQLVGILGLYAAAGIGLAYVSQLAIVRRGIVIRWAGVSILTLILLLQIYWTTRSLVNYYTVTKDYDPCAISAKYSLDMNLARQLNDKFNLDAPECASPG